MIRVFASRHQPRKLYFAAPGTSWRSTNCAPGSRHLFSLCQPVKWPDYIDDMAALYDSELATAKLEYEKRVRRRQKQQQEQKQMQQQGNQCDRVSSHTACLSSVPPAASLPDFDTSIQTTADLGLGTSTLSSFQDSS